PPLQILAVRRQAPNPTDSVKNANVPVLTPPIKPSGNKLQRNHRKDGVGKISILPFTQVSVMSE
ncbi:MAG: hypothetical protein IJF32_12130, partial [Oscillospiraceae bacterium]|nr:hypothetical protein [Oscillospiraceae bacterium]